LGWARYTVAESRCGTVVVLYTYPGMLQLDGVDMQFNEGVAGAFSRAGFKVTSLRRGRRSEDPDGHGLLTTAAVVGKFRYLSDKNLDLSQLSCGDDRPTIKGPFMPGPDGSNPQDIAYRQTILQRCNFAGLSDCPDGDLRVDFQGMSYYRRTMETRAKYQAATGKYFSISRLEFPEIPNGPSLVIVSNGVTALRYTIQRGNPVPQYCMSMENARSGDADVGDTEFPDADDSVEEGEFDNVDTVNPDSAPRVDPADDVDYVDTERDTTRATDPNDKVVVRFLGYNVLNGVYVRHFTATTKGFNDTVTTVDYYEHYDEKRMYSVPMTRESQINCFESASESPADTLMQDEDYYPSFDDDAAQFLSWPCGFQHNETTGIWLDGYEPQTNANMYVGKLWTAESDEKYFLELHTLNEANIAEFYGAGGAVGVNQTNTTLTEGYDRPPPDGYTGQSDSERERDRRVTGRKRRLNMVAGWHEDPVGDACVLPYPMMHYCNTFNKKLFNNICEFQMMTCRPHAHNQVAYPAFYANMLFKCQWSWQVVSGVKIVAGGQIQIGFSLYDARSLARKIGYYSASYNHPYGWPWGVRYGQYMGRPSDIMMCSGPPQLYVEGWVWFRIEFSILGVGCSIQFDFKIRYEAFDDEMSVTIGRNGACGALGFGVELTLKWSKAKLLFFPKAPPTGFEIMVTGSLTIDECIRVCIPHASCGWRGCRSWWSCHRGCVKVRLAAKLGPYALN
jgi:hypothetical protein